MKNYICVLISFICIAIFSACTAPKYIYTPASANLLLLEKKNDLKAAVNFVQAGTVLGFTRSTKDSRGIDLQGAYAITDKAGLKINAYTKQEKSGGVVFYQNDPAEMKTYKKQGIEISGGIYNFSGKQAKAQFQLFAGAGTGKFSLNERRLNGYLYENFYHNMNYFKTYVQPALSIKSSPYYHVTLGSSLSLIKYYNVRTNYTDLSDEPLGYVETKPSIFIDFVLQNEFGFKRLKGIKFQWQLGFTDLLTRFPVPGSSFENNKYDYNKAWLALGIIADIRALIKH